MLWFWIKLFPHSTHTLISNVWLCPDRSGIKSLANLLRKDQINDHCTDLHLIYSTLKGFGESMHIIIIIIKKINDKRALFVIQMVASHTFSPELCVSTHTELFYITQ